MKKTQFGWIFLGVIILIFGFIIYQNRNLNTLLILSALAIVLLLLFYKLTISITDQDVKFSMGIGIIKGKYKLSDINYCKPLSYITFGWGIRLRPGVILFNVSGNKAIELEIKNKNRKIWIGTNKPEEISQYINSMKAKG